MAMATDCEDVSAQMMELLYGELPSDARATVDAHVAGCARCRSELEGFEKTRAAARAGLDEAPPARARAAIMKAAAAHLAAQAQPAVGKPAVPKRVSFWDRLRAGWAVPTFATVGAVAVFVIANRVFLNPEKALDSGRAVHNEESSPAPSAAPVAPPAAPSAARHRGGQAAPPAEEPSDPMAAPPAPARPSNKRDISDNAVDGLDSLLPPERSAGASAGHGKKAKKPALAAPAAGYGGLGADRRADDDRSRDKDSAPPARLLKGEGGERRFAQPPPAKPAPAPANAFGNVPRPAPADDEKFAPAPPPREAAAVKQKEAEKAPVAKKAPRGPIESLTEEDKPAAGLGIVGGGGPAGRASASGKKADAPGSPAAQAAPTTPAPRPATTATGERNETRRSVQAPAPEIEPAPPPPAPPAAAAPTQSKARAKMLNDGDFAGEEGSAAAAEPQAKAEKQRTRMGATEILIQRADRLYADGRWSEAADAYRDLLRNDPRNRDAERWRQRLVVADRNADVNERPATVAKRKAAPSKTAESADAKASRAPQQAAPRTSKGAKASGKASVSDDAMK
jgi:hypothetical protein